MMNFFEIVILTTDFLMQFNLFGSFLLSVIILLKLLTSASSCIMQPLKIFFSSLSLFIIIGLRARRIFENQICSPVAQSVERVAVNHHVRGSSPRWGARIKKPNFQGVGLFRFSDIIKSLRTERMSFRLSPPRRTGEPKQVSAFSDG